MPILSNFPSGSAYLKGYVDAAVRKAAPVNLLDNSDFTNPVNQRGFVSGSEVPAYSYFLDRWVTAANTVYPTYGPDGIGGLGHDICQRLNLTAYIGKKMTFVLYSDYETVLYYTVGTIFNSNEWGFISASSNWECSITVQGNNIWQCNFRVPCKYAALYEGEYTVDTIPEYHPKGYENELLVCRQYDPFNGVYIGLSNFTKYCNPNLLHNWYFLNPVNQRREDVYANGDTAGDVSGIDRWRTQYRGTKYSVSNHTLTYDDSYTSDGTIQLNQRIPNDIMAAIAGKTVTLSVLAKTKSISFQFRERKTWEGVVQDTISDSGTDYNLFSVTGTAPTIADSSVIGQFSILSRTLDPIDLVACKLELGSEQTLAHLENGSWVLNEIPEFDIELLKCQKYYISMNPGVAGNAGGTQLGSGVAINSTIVRILVPTPVRMSARTTLIKPAVECPDYTNFFAFGDGGKISITSMSAGYVTSFGVTVNCTLASEVTTNQSFDVYNTGGLYFAINAEL